VVCAASYEARKFGVHSAMPVSEAVRRCPSGIFVTPRMGVYENESRAVMHILESFSPLIEQVSVDEAFLDMTGSEKLLGSRRTIASAMAGRIKNELDLSASIGIAPNKYLAKISSDINKPAGITEAPFDQQAIETWLAPMPAGRVWGIGKKTGAVLESHGIRTIGDLQVLTKNDLAIRLGRHGENLFTLCQGIDDRPVSEESSVSSISREHTFNRDCADRDEWLRVLFILSQDVARQARQAGVKGATVVLTWRRPDFSIPVGKVPQTQSRSQNAHTAGSARQHSLVHLDNQRCYSRCKHSGLTPDRSRSILSARSRIPGLFPIAQHSYVSGFLYHTNQVQLSVSPIVFTSGKKVVGYYLRSNRCAHGILHGKRLSGQTSPYSLSRYRYAETSDLSNQQFLAGRHNNRSTVQMQVADRTVLQVDQATPPHQGILRNFVQCSQDAAMDRNSNLCPDCHYQKTIEHRCASLQHIADSEHYSVREKPAVTGAFRGKYRH
jgi:DNA polymerase-4